MDFDKTAPRRTARVVSLNAHDAMQLDTLTLAALSVQHTPVLSAIHPFAALPAELVLDQLREATRRPVDALKIGDPGMRSIFALEEHLVDFRRARTEGHCPIVLDPELEHPEAGPRHGGQARKAIREHLCRLADALVLNTTEAWRLCGRPARTPNEVREACKRLFDLGPSWVIIGAGRGEGHAVDWAYDGRDFVEFGADRIPERAGGAGAVFSAAITGYLARGATMLEAVEGAKALVSRAIKAALPGPGSLVWPQPIEGLNPTPIQVELEVEEN